MTAFIAILRKKAREHRERRANTPQSNPKRIRAEDIKAEFCDGLADDIEKLIAKEKAKLNGGQSNGSEETK